METNGKMTTVLFWTIGGVLLLTGLYFLYLNYTSSAIPTDKYSQATEPPGHGVVGNASLDKDTFDTTITYTDNGFVPADITIAQGTRVRFINQSSEVTWPAVGVHPTHTLYPEKEPADCLGSAFDACQDLKKGEFYDFTFYYIGAWPYHDHVHAYNNGTITVVAKNATTTK